MHHQHRCNGPATSGRLAINSGVLFAYPATGLPSDGDTTLTCPPTCVQEVQQLCLPDIKAEADSCAGALIGFDEAVLACGDSDMCLASRRYMPCTGRSNTGALVMGLTEKLNQNRGRTSLSIGRSSGGGQVGAATYLSAINVGHMPCCTAHWTSSD
jgi:hypothetical protein